MDGGWQPAILPFPQTRDSHFRRFVRLSWTRRLSARRGMAVSTVPPSVDEVVDPEPADDKSRAVVIERLFREHNEALIRFLRGRVGSRHEALEVAQEAYVRLLSLDQPGAVSYLRAFLF